MLRDAGRKHRPKHAEWTWNNKLIYIVRLVGYFHSSITMHGFANIMDVTVFSIKALNTLRTGDADLRF